MILVVFSKDRPLLLDAALRSWRKHCLDAASTTVKVLYKASTSRMLSLYQRLMQEHPRVDFAREGDFRRDLLTLLRGRDHVLFAADNTVFIKDFTISEMVATLNRHPQALGFSLRLGLNTTYCFTMDRAQKPPDFEPLEGGGLKYRWPGANYDFGYPLELSSSIYRAKEMLPFLKKLEFGNPNTLENVMSRNAGLFRQSHPFLLCREQSAAFSIQADKIQQVCQCRASSNTAFSSQNPAALFSQGQRIAIEPFDAFIPQACHQKAEFKTAAAAPRVPLVSVVIPCHQQARYLPEAVASVVAQTHEDWEIIIVNDGSPDDTSAVARALIQQHAGRRIRLLEKKNGGLAHARNAGIRAAEGAYILPLDADDKISPPMLEKTVALLENDPGIAIAYTDVRHFGAAEKTIQAAEFDFKMLCLNNQLNYCSLFRREVWDLAGGYNPNMIWGYEDWDFWISVGENGFAARRIPEALLQYRVKNASMYAEALAHDQELRARIVLNHPALYDANKLLEAAAIWSNPALPAPPGAPKVSVIVPTYNRHSTLEETLRSIASQTFQNFEIIVVNDNGLDVQQVIRRCQANVEIIHLRHGVNKGLAAARNAGLRRARGKYVAYLDDDDIFLPGHLETLVNFMESGGHKVAYTDAWCAEEEGAGGTRKIIRRQVLYSSDWDQDRILVENFVPVLCFIHERVIAIAAGGFDERLSTHEDWDFWIRLSRLCAPVHIKKTTCEFRVRKDGSSITSGSRADFLRTARIIYKKHKALAAGKKQIRRKQRQFIRLLRQEPGMPSFWTFFAARLGSAIGGIFRRRKQ